MPDSFVIEKTILPTLTLTSGGEESLNNEKEIEIAQGGIGNTLGLKITGGFDFMMPITIFYVKEKSHAKAAGLKLGDSIVTINGKDTSKMTLKEANDLLEQVSKQDVKLGITKNDEVDDDHPNKEPLIHEVVLGVDGKVKKHNFEHKSEIPRDAYHQHPERKAWHPIMWPHPEYFLPENYHEELPHKRIVRNVRKLLSQRPSIMEIENLLLALPRGSRPKRVDDDDD
ncbi:unnamed protein product [Diamesa serratosioi]